MPDSEDAYNSSFSSQLALERLFQLSIELVIDIVMILIKVLDLGMPSDEENAFDKLDDHLQNIEKYKSMKRFRNVLVHRYEGIDNKIVYYNAKNNIDDFYQFIEEVQEILKKNDV